MNKFFLITLYCLITATTLSQPLPDGYILLYQQSFSADAALKDFRFSCQDAWIIKGAKENRYLEFSADTTYITAFRSPMILGIMSQHIFGDFILEADLMQTGREYERRDMCIFFSVRDSSHYYYIHLASQSSDSSHGIFLVKNGPRYKVSDWQTEGMSWGNEKWHKVRVERNIVTRMVSVYVDDMKKPVMTTRNPELVMGYLGFGSFDDSGRIDNIKIWGPTSIPEEADFFEVKK